MGLSPRMERQANFVIPARVPRIRRDSETENSGGTFPGAQSLGFTIDAHSAIVAVDMKPDIRSKLNHELRQPIRSERQVVYILVELRKLLELRSRTFKRAKKPKDYTYATLEFCCDWAVHPVMDWENGRRIVRRFNQYEQVLHELTSGGERAKTEPPQPEFLKEMAEIMAMAKFRTQTRQFLQAQRLSPNLAVDNKRWHTFLSYYAAVIEDCPLKCVEEGLEYAEEVTVKLIHSRHKPIATEVQLELIIQWEWVSKKTGHRCVEQFSA